MILSCKKVRILIFTESIISLLRSTYPSLGLILLCFFHHKKVLIVLKIKTNFHFLKYWLSHLKLIPNNTKYEL